MRYITFIVVLLSLSNDSVGYQSLPTKSEVRMTSEVSMSQRILRRRLLMSLQPVRVSIAANHQDLSSLKVQNI